MKDDLEKTLTKRQTEIAKLVIGGCTNKEVQCICGITEKTVKFHLTNIYKKLNVNSRYTLRHSYAVPKL